MSYIISSIVQQSAYVLFSLSLHLRLLHSAISAPLLIVASKGK